MLNSQGFTALHLAARTRHFDALQLLLEFGADVNVRSRKGGPTALHLASSGGNIEAVTLLLEKKADPALKYQTGNGGTALHCAVRGGYAEVSRLLLKANVSVNSVDNGGNTPLHLAAREGYIEIVKLLLEANADIKAKNHKREIPVDVVMDLAVLDTLKEHKLKMKTGTNQKKKDWYTSHLIDLTCQCNFVIRLCGYCKDA